VERTGDATGRVVRRCDWHVDRLQREDDLGPTGCTTASRPT